LLLQRQGQKEPGEDLMVVEEAWVAAEWETLNR
jgi:hypothetical protein